MDSSKLIESIEENRQNFTAYNIARLRELIRYLPESRLTLFRIIPFLLHINSEGFPGFVETADTIHGIHRFENSGFYQHALKQYSLTPSQIESMTPEDPLIKGLYLMGSAGTLTQTDKSDFDYWVITDRLRLTDSQLAMMAHKMALIESWCKTTHHQDVTFFIMDVEEIRANNFPAVDEESSGSAQKTLLKDEFYRTFIMIAGKIPYWAVLPSGITGDIYDTVISDISRKTGDEYINTGHLEKIDTCECLGAVLWQVYKARNDPVKALIKSSLVAYYAFADPEEKHLVSSQVKSGFSRSQIDDHILDPYTIVFEKIIEIYKDLDDLAGLDLIRRCIILRIYGYPLISVPDPESPKGRLLARIIRDWSIPEETILKLQEFQTWPEHEKITFDEMVFNKLSFLYELILRNDDNETISINMIKEDLEILKNRTAAFLQKKPGKLTRCSTFLSKKRGQIFFTLTDDSLDTRQSRWSVALKNQQKHPLSPPLFTGPELLKATGWLISNRLLNKNSGNLSVSYNTSINRFSTPETVIQAADNFFSDYFPRPDAVFKSPPVWEKLVIMLKTETPDRDSVSSFDFLLANSWGEFYFDSKDLPCVESTTQKWYIIAEFIFQHMDSENRNRLHYIICEPADDGSRSALKTISDCLRTLSTSKPSGEKPAETNLPDRKPIKPFLDLL